MHSIQSLGVKFRETLKTRSLRLALALLSVVLVAAGCGTTQPPAGQNTSGVELLLIAAGDDSPALPIGNLNGAQLKGTVTILAKESTAANGVAFYLNDPEGVFSPLHVAEEAPYTVDLDTTELEDGHHTLTVRVIGMDEGTVLARAEFVVANTSGDPNGPSIPGPVDPNPTDPPSEPTPEPTPPEADDDTPFLEVPPATLYVSPDGSDSNSGRTVDDPLRTVQRAADIVRPGDVVYLRGGVYPIQVGFNTSGTSSEPIVWTSYPGEWAIFDGRDQPQMESQHRIWITNVSWNVFANFEVRNSPREGMWVSHSHHNVFQNIITHDNHYSGIYNYMSDRNRYEYIVTYNNFDVLNPGGKPGDDADGISIHSGDSNYVNRMTAFHNSDDGIDAWMSTNTIIENSVSFGNGRGSHGNGNGVKAGGNNVDNRNIVRNTLSFGNRSSGFTQNGGRNVTFINNTSYDNAGYDYVGDNSSVFYNNIATGGRLSIGNATAQNNSWNLGISDPQFVSTNPDDEAFLSLSSSSPAIDAGRDVGLTYSGAAPDLGALEYGETQKALGMPGFDPVTVLNASYSSTIASAGIQ